MWYSSSISEARFATFHFVDKYAMADAIGLGHHTLKRYRLQGILVEDIHWVRLNKRCIRYNRELIQDWIWNRNDPKSHLQAIELYLNNRICNQRKSAKWRFRNDNKHSHAGSTSLKQLLNLYFMGITSNWAIASIFRLSYCAHTPTY